MCCLEAIIKCQLAMLLISLVPSRVWPPCLWKAATNCIRRTGSQSQAGNALLLSLQGPVALWPAPKERVIIVPISQVRAAGLMQASHLPQVTKPRAVSRDLSLCTPSSAPAGVSSTVPAPSARKPPVPPRWAGVPC